jgi:type III secretion system HrpB2-like protein
MSVADSIVTAIPAVSPVSAVNDSGASVTAGTWGGNTDYPASQTSAARFKEMIDSAGVRNSMAHTNHTQPSALSRIVETQDGSFADIKSALDTFETQLPHMNLQQITAGTLDLQYRITQAMMKLDLGMGAAQGGKGAVQNLLKNQ